MLKQSLMLSILGIVSNCSDVMAEGFNASIKKSLDSNHGTTVENGKVLSSADEVKKFFYEQIKSLSIFAEPTNNSQPVGLSRSNFLNALMNSTKKEPPSKYRASKLFEMGMNMAISSKMSWGAELSVSKYKNNFETEVKSKQPVTGFRLKPDIYTFQVGLKYKI